LIICKKIDSKETYDFLLNIHYAKRIPSISYAFGAFKESLLVGVITYGTPPSSPLKKGIAGIENAKDVLELNRLCFSENIKNGASQLISFSIKQLPKNKIIVSYADTEQYHKGIVYQATNFIYTGLSAKRTDWKIKGLEHLHGQTIADMSRGQKNRAEWMRNKFGDKFYLKERPRKHRYIFINGSKTYKRNILSKLKYNIESYPK
tara:strand:- start:464 stop:1078 length:615 start_codon:yes stop_codon:yes gene_type:complete